MRKRCFVVLLSIELAILSSFCYADEELMRKYEPFLFFHKEDIYKELFYPMDVEDYISKCSLWYDLLGTKDEKLKNEGDMDSELLATLGRNVSDSDKLYLKFVEKYHPSDMRPVYKDFHWNHVQDALVEYLNTFSKCTYYFRQFIEPDYGYLVLQYWFFYAFNSWGAYSFGWNTHEGDWESITLFLDPITQVPIYVAYSAHHNKGDEVRKRWEEIRKTGTHPNVFVALGSHANYFEPKFFDVRILVTEEEAKVYGPLVDRANGTGMIIGPLKPEGAYDWKEWEKRIILEDETHSLPNWAKFYKGKWGMDSVIDELGFTGPRFPPFQDDNNIWYHPAKWAKVSPLLIADLVSIDASSFPEIKLYTTVEAGSEPVLNLGLSNFRVYEDQTRESPISVSSVGAAFVGTSVCIIMDTSGSMEYAIQSAKEAAISFVNNLKPEDKAVLIRFNEYVTIEQPFTDDKGALTNKIRGLYADGYTAFYDAVYKGIAMTSPQPGIKAIVALTDGKDNRSIKTAKEVIDYAKSVSVPIYIVGLIGSDGLDERTLRLMADETEGKYYQTPKPEELKKLYESISEKLKNLYEVSYTTHNKNRDKSIRSVTVQVIEERASGQDTATYIAPGLEGAISGIVLDAKTGNPIKSASIVVQHDTKYFSVTDASVSTNQNGEYLIGNLSTDYEYRITVSATNYYKATYPSLVKVKTSETTKNVNFELQPVEEYHTAKQELIRALRDGEEIYVEEENKAEQFLKTIKDKGISATDKEKEAVRRLYLSESFTNEAYMDSKRLAQLATSGLGGFVDIAMAVTKTCSGVGEVLKKIPFVGEFLASPYIAAKDEMVNHIAIKSHMFLYQNYNIPWTLKGDVLLREAIGKGYDRIFTFASKELATRSFSDAMAETRKFIEKEFFLGIYELTTANFVDKSVKWAESKDPVFRVGKFSNAEQRVNQVLYFMNTLSEEKIKRGETLIWAGDTIEKAGAIASGVMLAGGAVLSAVSAKTVIGLPLAAVLIPLSTKIAVATNAAAGGMKVGVTVGIAMDLWSTMPNYVKEATAYSFDMPTSALPAPPFIALSAEEASYNAENKGGKLAPSAANLTLKTNTTQHSMDDYNSLLVEMRGYIENDETEKVKGILDDLVKSGNSLMGDTNIGSAQIIVASPLATGKVPDYDALYSNFETDVSRASYERINLYTILASYLANPADTSIKELLILQINKTIDTNTELEETLNTTTQALNEAGIAIPNLVVVKNFSTPNTVLRGEPFTISAVIKNIGQWEASEINVKLSIPKGSGLRLLEESVKRIKYMDGDEEKEISWMLEYIERHSPTEGEVNLITISVDSASDTPDFSSLPPTYIFIPSPPPTPPTGGKLSNKNIYAYPNPFNPEREPVNIRYSLSKDANVTIKIYDASGELVTTLIEEQPKEKTIEYSESWDGRNDHGDIVANGVYFYVITTTGDEKAAGKIAVLR